MTSSRPYRPPLLTSSKRNAQFGLPADCRLQKADEVPASVHQSWPTSLLGVVRLFQRLLDCSRRTHDECPGLKANFCRREQMHEMCMSSTALFEFRCADPPATVSLTLPSLLTSAFLTWYYQAIPAATVILSLFRAITLMSRVQAATSTALSSSNGLSVVILRKPFIVFMVYCNI